MEKIINKLINEFIRGTDTYTHNGSTWLIFTESKQWAIELTKDKTLWYNYYFFKSVFSYTSMDVGPNQQYITKWVEDNLINGVTETRLEINITEGEIDDIIQDGVKETQFNFYDNKSWVEGVIKEGVKKTNYDTDQYTEDVIEVIRDGIKETHDDVYHHKGRIDGVINNGVKQ
jgi:hypothetical protein